MNRTFAITAAALSSILLVGTIGYWMIGGREYSLLDCFYMTMITISTIGFTEVIDLAGKPIGRIFTILVAFSGIGILTFAISTLTANVVEGELSQTFKRKKVRKMIENLSGHYIVCGLGRLGAQVVEELARADRPQVIINLANGKCQTILDKLAIEHFIEGDATQDAILNQAGIERAKGVFAATGDDNCNLVISLSAKHLNPGVKVVARCEDPFDIAKMKKAGADSVLSPTTIGGMRMVADMVKPSIGQFVEMLLRDELNAIQLEEIKLSERLAGEPLTSLKLKDFSQTVLIGIKTKKSWVYNPPEDHVLSAGDRLIALTTPEERQELEKA